MQPGSIEPSMINILAPSEESDQQPPTPTVYIHDIEMEDTITYPMVGERKVRRDWLVNVPEEEYKQNIFICTKLAAVRAIEQKNMGDKSNLFKLIHLRAESTNILQNKIMEDFQQHFKNRNNKSWNLTAQKQGTNFFKTIYERKCNFNFDHINIISQTKKQHTTLNPYECKYKIQEPKDASNDKTFPWLQKATCRIILTDSKGRKFAIYIPKRSDAEYIVHQIQLKKVCQNMNRFNDTISKAARLFGKKVIAASAEKLNQNGRYFEFKREEKQKQALIKKDQLAQQSNQPAEASKGVKSPKFSTLTAKRSNFPSKLQINTKPRMNNSSHNGSMEQGDSLRKNRPKVVSPLLKIRPSHLQHPPEQPSEMEDLSLSKMMMFKVRTTIDASFAPFEELMQSRLELELNKNQEMNVIEEKVDSDKNQSRKASSQLSDLSNPLQTPTPNSRRRKRSFFVKDEDNNLLLKQVDVNQQQFQSSGYMDKQSIRSMSSVESLPKINLDIYVTIFHLELFIKHFEDRIIMEFIQLIEPQTETSKTKLIQFRKVLLQFNRSKHNPLVFVCEHKCFTFSSYSDQFRVSVQLPDKKYSTDITLSKFDVSFLKCYGDILYFKDAPFAAYFLYFTSKNQISPVVHLKTVEYLKDHVSNYQLRYRVMQINKTKAMMRLKFNQNAWEFYLKKPSEDFLEKLVYLGIPDKFKEEFYSNVPEVKLKSENISYYQCQIILNTFTEPVRDKIMYSLNSKHDLFLQLSSFKDNQMLQERIKGLVSYYEFKTGSSEVFMLALIRSIVQKIKPIIMKLKTKDELQKTVRLYLFIQYEIDELLEETYSYMHNK